MQKAQLSELIIEQYCCNKIRTRLICQWQQYFGPNCKKYELATFDDNKTKYHKNKIYKRKATKWIDNKGLKEKDLLIKSRLHDFRNILDTKARHFS